MDLLFCILYYIYIYIYLQVPIIEVIYKDIHIDTCCYFFVFLCDISVYIGYFNSVEQDCMSNIIVVMCGTKTRYGEKRKRNIILIVNS